MSTQSQFRGFGRSWTGGDQHMRVSDADRSEVADRLAQHFAEGRLDQAEYDERVSRAMSAKTRADLSGLFDDLPDTGAPAADAGPSPRVYPRRRRGPLRPILFVLLVLAVLSVAGHIASHLFFWWFTPWWLILLVVILIVSRGGRSRAR